MTAEPGPRKPSFWMWCRVRGRRAWIAIIPLAGCGLGWIAWTELLYQQQLDISREWARLAPYPASAKDLRASTEGGLFTRAFRVSFSAPAGDIESWLRASPSTRAVTPDKLAGSRRHFVIAPGGGARHAEVTVDDASGFVSIYVYWS